MRERGWKVPQPLQSFRKTWKEEIKIIYETTKSKIEEAAKSIPVRVETEKDGSRLIEFKLWWKKRKILDPKLKTHSDENYFYGEEWISITKRDERVKLWWMMWDDVDSWSNKELAKYVKEKQQEWLHIPSETEIKKLLEELGKEINSSKLPDQIAILMYLTGMDWDYRLSMRDGDTRSRLRCDDNGRYISCYISDDIRANLCMIACEWDDTGKIDDTKDTENAKFETIWTIAWLPVEYDEAKRIVKFAWEIFDLNPHKGKMDFIGKVSQYDNLFGESVRKIMFTLNI
jgi:hypothetical protein